MQDLSALASLWSMTEIFRLNGTFWHPELHPHAIVWFHYKSDWIKNIFDSKWCAFNQSFISCAWGAVPSSHLSHFILFVLSSSYNLSCLLSCLCDIYLASVNINLFHSCLALKLFLLFVFILSVLKGANGANVFRNNALDTYNNVMVILCWWFWRISLFYISLRC